MESIDMNDAISNLLIELKLISDNYDKVKNYKKRKIIKELVDILNIISILKIKEKLIHDKLFSDQEFKDLVKELEKTRVSTTEKKLNIYLNNQKLIDKMNVVYENFLEDIKLESPNFDIKSCSFDDLAYIIHEKSNDKKFISFFDKQIKDNTIIFNSSKKKLSESDLNGLSINFPSLNKEYFVLQKDKRLSYYNIFVLIHELIHGYITGEYNINMYYSVIREIIPKLSELLYEDVMSNLGFNKEVMIHKYYTIRNLKHQIARFNKLSDKNIKYRHIDNSEKVYNNFRYLLDDILSLKIYYKYLNDKELSKYQLDKLLKKGNTDNFIEILESLNISKKELNDTDTIKKYVKSYKTMI